ncbi:MAG TPA: T9SS type A sorting domain-containing protein, partial [Ignavibacteriaceae bacterium]|nr:T9SS type A sorting domain-containing protein [Ignavibacteriaceae bacterium]
MKTLTLIVLLNCMINLSFAQWIHIPAGMENKYIYSMAVNGNNIFAGTSSNGVYLSENNGTSWSNTSLNNRVIQALYVDNNTVYAGTSEHGIYYTTNNGSNWTQTSLNNKTIYSITVKDNVLYAGTDSSGVFYSTNNGADWEQTSFPNYSVYSLTTAGGVLIAGTSENGVFLSTDGGNSWIPTNLFNRAVFCFDSTGNKIFAGTSQGIYESTNFGFNWTQTTFNEEITSSMVINENLFFAGTFSGGVYVSVDSGMTWNQWNEGLTQLTASALLILNNFIYNGTQNSVFRRPVGELTGTGMILNEVPERFSLSQNYPNPFNPSTKINWTTSKFSKQTLKVYDILGNEIAVLIDEEKPAGRFELTFDASNLSSGIYFYKLQTGDF